MFFIFFLWNIPTPYIYPANKINYHMNKLILATIVTSSTLFFACVKHASTETANNTPKEEIHLTEKKDAKLVEIQDEEIQYEMEADDYMASPPVQMSAKSNYISNNSVSRGGIATGLAYNEPTEKPTNHNTESYNHTPENEYKIATNEPLSTFSIDVDAASYTNTRRMINNGHRPPQDAVRIEEYINYFNYDYPQPTGDAPFSINTEFAACPWNTKHQLLHVGLQGKRIPFEKIAPMNLVFLIDVSGSMSDENKLPLLKKSLTLLTNQLRDKDKIAIVVYAGAAGLVLESTSNKKDIVGALDNLNAGGSTAGGEGIKLAYSIAKQNFIKEGINRVLIATDGDFNVGASSDGEMTRLVEDRRDDGIFITALGFGMGNYKDSKIESIADKGNGNYFYIDNLEEARKTLVTELDGTLYTIAKDVKIQMEFNPSQVKAYRLIGYVNRKLNNEDFNNDKKDAGELGAGHTVTALYEIIPAGSNEVIKGRVDELKYQTPPVCEKGKKYSEVATVKLRYKNPTEDTSLLLSTTVENKPTTTTSNNFRFSAAVAAYGQVLSKSEFINDFTLSNVLVLASAAKGNDIEGYRSDFIQLVKLTELVKE